jgi:hypothetical protein
MGDVVDTEVLLPPFEMDCRDWLVVLPEDAGLPDEVGGAPLVAVLSTAVVDEGFRSVSGVLTLALLDGEELLTSRVGEVAEVLLDGDDRCVRFLLPAPGGELVLVAEFALGVVRDVECEARIMALMESFRWAA